MSCIKMFDVGKLVLCHTDSQNSIYGENNCQVGRTKLISVQLASIIIITFRYQKQLSASLLFSFLGGFYSSCF